MAADACFVVWVERSIHTVAVVTLSSWQTRGGKMTVGGVLSHIWRSEGVPGLFRCVYRQ